MDALGDALDNGYSRAAYLRIGAGFGLLLAGAVVLGIGILDLVPEVGTRLGLGETQAASLAIVLGGGTIVAVLGVAGLKRTARMGRGPLAAGVVLSTLAVLVAASGATAGGSTLPAVSPVVWGTFALGVLLMYAGNLARMIEPDVSRTPETTPSPRTQTQEFHQPAHADGGEDEDDDLEFPLDDEE